MQPLTDNTPKPLLKVGGKPLLSYHLEKLVRAGIEDVIINTSYLGEQIENYYGATFIGEANQNKMRIHYSREPEALETAGAILQALPLLGDAPFLLMNGDVWTDYDFTNLIEKDLGECQGHLVLVENPSHNLVGDFSIQNGLLCKEGGKSSMESNMTFSGLSVLSPRLIQAYPSVRDVFPLGEVFRASLENKKLSAELYTGKWFDIGTVERLKNLDRLLSECN